MEKHLSKRTHEIEWSGIRVMFALADKIPNVVNLGIGQPDFDTPEFIREAAKKALDDGYTRYPPAKGFQDLREEVSYSRKVSKFHTPLGLREMYDFFKGQAFDWFKNNPNDHPRLRPYQIEATAKIETAIQAKKRQMLIAMATGTLGLGTHQVEG